MDAAGNVFVANFTLHGTITKVAPDGTQTTLGSGFAAPFGVTVDSMGSIFIADGNGGQVFQIQRSVVPALTFANTNALDTSSDSPKAVTVSNVGNDTLTGTIGAPSDPDFTLGSGGCGSTLSLLSGVSCNLSYSFTPLKGGAFSGTATLTDNSVNVTNASQTITLQGTGLKLSQTITFTPVPAQTIGTPYTLGATASSNLPVTYTTSTSNFCTVSGNTVTFLAFGQCVVTAMQAGNDTYNAAQPVTQAIGINKKQQQITFNAIPSGPLGGTVTVSATASSNLPVTFSSKTTGICTISGTTVTLVSPGLCDIQATQSGDDTYFAALPVDGYTQVPKQTQIITFNPIPSQVLGGTVTLSASTNASLTVSFTSLTTGVCTVSGMTASLISTGSCSIRADQTTGNGLYYPAQPVTQSFQISGSPIVTGQTPGTPRNNFTGFVGFQFTVGSTPINVFALGRFFVPGNTGTHVVKLVSANGIDVPGGSTTVAEAGGSLGQYKYGNLTNAVTLQANTSYYLLSQESAGGDQFYDLGPITIGPGVTVNGPAYADQSNSYNTVYTLPGQAYGPVSFLFGSQSANLSAAITSPSANAMLSGNNVPVVIATTGAVTTLQLQVDGANKGNPVMVGANQSSPYTLSLDTTTLSNGAHQLQVVVSDSQGGSASSGAVAVTVNNNGGGGGSATFLTAQTPGAARNNFTGFVGLQFTVGSTPLTVNSLGRFFLTGNTGTHLLKLVNAGTNQDVPGGSVSVSLTGSAGAYKYGLLASPVTLLANTTYYLLSQETAGGDTWNDLGPVTPTIVAIVNGPAYVDGNGNYNAVTTLPGNAYGPVNFTYGAATSALSVSITSPSANATVSGSSVQVTVATGGPVTSVQLQVDGSNVGSPSVTPPYSLTFNSTSLTNGAHTLRAVASNGQGQSVSSSLVAVTVNNGAAPVPTPFITGQTPGAARNNFTGFVGISFTVGASPITVTQLGRIYVSGNSGTHTLKLVNAATGMDVPNGSLQLALAGGGTPGQFKYAQLTTTVKLQANTTVYLLTLEASGGDTWYDFGAVTATGAARVDGPTYTDGTGAYVVVSTLPNYAYGPVGFTYQ